MTDIRKRSGKAFCHLSGREIASTRMGPHIALELKYLQSSMMRNGTYWGGGFIHIEVQHLHSKYFWMHLLVNNGTTLGEFDSFLRSTWFQCCEHESKFDFHGVVAYSPRARGAYAQDAPNEHFDFVGNPLHDWDAPIVSAMLPGMTGIYEYDLGSSTHLSITSHRMIVLPFDDQVLLISRNPPVERDDDEHAVGLNTPRVYDSDCFSAEELYEPPTVPHYEQFVGRLFAEGTKNEFTTTTDIVSQHEHVGQGSGQERRPRRQPRIRRVHARVFRGGCYRS